MNLEPSTVVRLSCHVQLCIPTESALLSILRAGSLPDVHCRGNDNSIGGGGWCWGASSGRRRGSRRRCRRSRGFGGCRYWRRRWGGDLGSLRRKGVRGNGGYLSTALCLRGSARDQNSRTDEHAIHQPSWRGSHHLSFRGRNRTVCLHLQKIQADGRWNTHDGRHGCATVKEHHTCRVALKPACLVRFSHLFRIAGTACRTGQRALHCDPSHPRRHQEESIVRQPYRRGPKVALIIAIDMSKSRSPR